MEQSPEHEIAMDLIEQYFKLPFIVDRYNQAPTCALVAVDEKIDELEKDLELWKSVRKIIKSKIYKNENG